MIDGGNRVLPDQGFGRNLSTVATADGTHVAVGQLVPGAGKGVGELVRVLEEVLRDGSVSLILTQGEVGGEHHWSMTLAGIMGIRHGAIGGRIRGDPLGSTGGALRLLPLVTKKVLEVVVVPLNRVGGPGTFESAGDGVATFSTAVAAHPAHTHILGRCAFRLRTDMGIGCGTVGLTEGVSTCDQGDSFLVVHRHAAEGLTDIPGGSDGVRIAVGAFRVDVDQTHLHGTEVTFQFTVATVALVSEPLCLGSPVDVVFRLEDILTASGETEGLEAHRLEGAVAGVDHQVRPGQAATVLLLHGPKQHARLVEVGIVGPAVEGSETQGSGSCTTTAIADAVGASAVPRHADEERSIMPVVGGPPLLGSGHDLIDVLAQFFKVDVFELFDVIEGVVHRTHLRCILVEHLEVELIGPPTLIGTGAGSEVLLRATHGGALADIAH